MIKKYSSNRDRELMSIHYTNKRRKRIKLIYNPTSGMAKKSPQILTEIIKELQDLKYIPELYITEPGTDYAGLVSDSLAQGIRMFVICGGDGTVSSVARAIYGTNATLGIIPSGTQNNVAKSLGIPGDIREAISVLRTGKRTRCDIGLAYCGSDVVPFIEICSVGLFSELFGPGDGIQHGDISRIGDFISTFTASTPSKIRLVLDGREETEAPGHVVLVANMPYIGRRFRVGPDGSYRDGFLDAFLCADIPKLDLMMGYMLKLPGLDLSEDSRIKHFRVKTVDIESYPEMSVLADGITLGKGKVHIEIRRRALTVIAGPAGLDSKKDD